MKRPAYFGNTAVFSYYLFPFNYGNVSLTATPNFPLPVMHPILVRRKGLSHLNNLAILKEKG